jgi:2-iminoacetate synthase
MNSFTNIFKLHDWDNVLQDIYAKTEKDVRAALNNADNCSLEDFKALISPAALPFLEEMAQISQAKTQKRFGKTIQMYVPLYLSNECQNICTYCGFSLTNKIPRKTLSDAEILKEVAVIKSMGFDHVLFGHRRSEPNGWSRLHSTCHAIDPTIFF